MLQCDVYRINIISINMIVIIKYYVKYNSTVSKKKVIFYCFHDLLCSIYTVYIYIFLSDLIFLKSYFVMVIQAS